MLYDLVVETEGELEMTSLAEKLAEAFGEEMGLERYVQKEARLTAASHP